MSTRLSVGCDVPFILVVGLDLTDQESSGYAFDQALRIAARIPRSEMHCVYVVTAETSAAKADEAVGLLKMYVSEKAAAIDVGGPGRAGVHIRRGEAAPEIAKLATDVGADMIVVGTRKGAHLRTLLLGSTAERVMASAPCPVFVAGPRPRPSGAAPVAIEPACPDCVAQRIATSGREWWCERHSEHHRLRRHHVYSYEATFPFSTHDSEVMPTGVD